MKTQCKIEVSSLPRPEPCFYGHNFPFKRTMTIPFVIGVAMTYPASYFTYNQYVHATTANYSYAVFSGDTPFINRVDSAKIGQNIIVSKAGKNETSAPIWLQQNREALRQMPPPSLQKMRTQWRASAEALAKLGGRHTF